MNIKFLKSFLTLSILGLLAWLSKPTPIDSWNVLSLKKIATMIFALAFIQIFGSILNKFLGSRNGTILTGFFGGLISSTATTMSIARKSKIKGSPETTIEMLIFLSSTGAMLLEGVLITFTGISNFHFSALLIFIGPLISSSAILYFYSRKLKNKSTPSNDIEFNVLPILKLSLFIIFILFVSKLLQKFFGQSGLIILTFIVSLFEIHGSVIANIQLHENGIISIKFLTSLLAISVFSSYLSKLFLISTFGSKDFRHLAIKSILILFSTIFVTWFISIGLSGF